MLYSESLTVSFSNMQTLRFEVWLTNASNSTQRPSQLPTTAKHTVLKSLSTVQITKQWSVVVEIWEELPSILLMVAKNALVGWALNFRFHMLLKGAVNYFSILSRFQHVCCPQISFSCCFQGYFYLFDFTRIPSQSTSQINNLLTICREFHQLG